MPFRFPGPEGWPFTMNYKGLTEHAHSVQSQCLHWTTSGSQTNIKVEFNQHEKVIWSPYNNQCMQTTNSTYLISKIMAQMDQNGFLWLFRNHHSMCGMYKNVIHLHKGTFRLSSNLLWNQNFTLDGANELGSIHKSFVWENTSETRGKITVQKKSPFSSDWSHLKFGSDYQSDYSHSW